MTLPTHISPPKRRDIDVLVDRLEHYMRFSITPEAKQRYARDLVAARKVRGDYEALGAHVDLDELAMQALAALEEERHAHN